MEGGIIMGENEVITDLSDIRLLVSNLYDEHEIVKQGSVGKDVNK